MTPRRITEIRDGIPVAEPVVIDVEAVPESVPPSASVTLLGRSPGARPQHGVVRVEVVVDGWRFEFEVEDDARATLRQRATRGPDAGAGTRGPLEIRAIIPGRVASVAVVAGDAVVAGQPLLVVEAMKMQNELKAPRDGVVDRVGAAPGATIDIGDVLIVLA